MTQNMNQMFLQDGSKRVMGRDARRINILIAKAVANAVKTTLGPKGQDKMIVDDLGDVTITNDGATIMEEMSIEHPIGKMMVEIAKTQDDIAGDGTTTVVVLSGELLKKAENLLDDDIHPSLIVKGYRLANQKAQEFLSEVADPVSVKDTDVLKQIAKTAMTGKGAEMREDLSNLVVDAVVNISDEVDGKPVVDLDNIKIEKKDGASISETELVKGVVVEKEIVHSDMPKDIPNAKIALIDSALEVQSTETDAKIQINSPDQLQSFLDQEEKMLRKVVDKIKASGANAVFCQKGIDDMAQHFLAKEGIMAVRRVKKSDMEKLAKATGAKIVSRVKELEASDLGTAKVKEHKVSGDEMIFVTECESPKAVTILVRGGSEHVAAEVERAIKDALGALACAIEDGKVVAGGGSVEMQLVMKMKEFAKTIGGREQLAIEAFADALEIVPRTLSESAGMDPINTIVALRSKHSAADGKYVGVDVIRARLSDMKSINVIEPLRVKAQAMNSASEVSEMILRIDDIIAGTSKPSPPGGDMPPGMGGMGGMM